MTYDDLLTRLNATLGGGRAARRQRRGCARATRSCWSTSSRTPTRSSGRSCSRAFVDAGVTLVLIADPKQAIYAFRGADVYAYLAAAATASDARDAAGQLAQRPGAASTPTTRCSPTPSSATRGSSTAASEPRAATERAAAASARRSRRRCACASSTAMSPGSSGPRAGFCSARRCAQHIARDLAADIVGCSPRTRELEHRAPDGTAAGERRISRRDIAVLVRTHPTPPLIREALDAARVPAVINGAGSVFATPPARDWLRLLEALDRPASPSRARAAALTPFLGWSRAVATADEEEWEEVHRRLHRWARILRDARASPR